MNFCKSRRFQFEPDPFSVGAEDIAYIMHDS